MARSWAWLEKKRGVYVIRYNDPVLKGPKGKPKVGIHCPLDDQGERIRSKAIAQGALDAFLAKNVGPVKRAKGSLVLPQRLTAMRLALHWKAAHPKHLSAPEYLSRIQWLVSADGIGFEYPQELTVQRLNDFKLRREYHGCNRPLAYLRSVLSWSVRNELMDPMPERVMGALSSPQSKRSSAHLMSAKAYALAIQEARRCGQNLEAIIHCLALYGWRPITACRVRVGDVDLSADANDCWIWLQGKDVSQNKTKEVQKHPLLPETVALLRPLIDGRAADAPLFLDPTGHPWKVKRERASQLTDWYHHHLKVFAPLAGNIYALKRFAIDRMLSGAPPWSRALKPRDVQTFTGHEDITMVLRYSVSSNASLREAAGLAPIDHELVVIEGADEHGSKPEADVVVWGGVDAKQHLTEADETVSYGT